ncbi:MAG: PAS domain S-box protein, partial [Actinomycetota bacterium]
MIILDDTDNSTIPSLSASRTSEIRYRRLFEAARDGILILDAETRKIIEVNPFMTEFLGYTREEFLGKELWEIGLLKDEAESIAAFQELEKNHYIRYEDLPLKTKDGESWEVEFISNVYTENGRQVIQCNIRDITERKRTERAIVMSEAAAQRRLSETQASILDALPAHICLLDADGNVLTVNAGWKKYALTNNYSESNFGIGTNYFEVCENAHGIDSEGAIEVVNGLRAVLSGASNHFEYEYPCKSPVKERWFRLMVTPLYGETSAGLVVMHIDTTDHRQTEEALRKTEANYRHLIESSPGIVYFNEPNPPYSLIYISPNIKTFGYSPEEWYATPGMWKSIIYKEDLERVLREFETAIDQNLDTDLTYRITARDGSIHWWQDKGRFVNDAQGNPIGWQGIILDITTNKGLEHQLRQAQKLESVGLLAGGIAHDFNNMLTAINGYSELTLRRLKPDDPLRHNIEEIIKAGQRSASLTHQLLAFSRQQVLQSVVTDLNEIITDTIKMLQRVIGENIQVTTTLNPKAGRVKVDLGQFSQIIMNLAVNARDAMPAGGKLTIETANVFLDKAYSRQHIGVPAGDYVMLAVSDNGTGMSEETKQRIFEPFFTTKEVGQGTGLGLATVYGIVKQSGGNIEVYSEEGVGTTFKVYFPRIAEQNDTAKVMNNSAEILKGTETILLVEDEEMVRNLSTEILEGCGYTVIAARNGLEALEICDKGNCQFDLLMTDVVMPQMGGRELAEKLSVQLPNLKILFTSGYTDDAVVRHGVIENNTNFIQKPFTPNALQYNRNEISDRDFQVLSRISRIVIASAFGV